MKQRHEDRHLQQHGQTARQRVELHLGVELLHLFLQARLIVSVLALQLLHERLHLLHLKRRFRLLVHQRRDQNTEDDRHDDDGQAPVAAEVIEEMDNVEYPVLKYVPHVQLFLPLYQRSPRDDLKEQDRSRANPPDDNVAHASP